MPLGHVTRLCHVAHCGHLPACCVRRAMQAAAAISAARRAPLIMIPTTAVESGGWSTVSAPLAAPPLTLTAVSSVGAESRYANASRMEARARAASLWTPPSVTPRSPALLPVPPPPSSLPLACMPKESATLADHPGRPPSLHSGNPGSVASQELLHPWIRDPSTDSAGGPAPSAGSTPEGSTPAGSTLEGSTPAGSLYAGPAVARSLYAVDAASAVGLSLRRAPCFVKPDSVKLILVRAKTTWRAWDPAKTWDPASALAGVSGMDLQAARRIDPTGALTGVSGICKAAGSADWEGSAGCGICKHTPHHTAASAGILAATLVGILPPDDLDPS